MGLAVALDDEPPLHDEVDSTHVRDLHLRSPPQPETAEHEPHQRLGSRLCRWIHEVPQAPEAARERTEDLPQIRLVDETTVPVAVQRRDQAPRWLTRCRLDESLDDRCMGGSRKCGARPPVAPYVTPPHRQATRDTIELHVQAPDIVREHAAFVEQGQAIQTAPVLYRAQHGGRYPGRQIRVPSCAQQMTRSDRPFDLATGHSFGTEVAEGSRGGGHGSRVLHLERPPWAHDDFWG